MTNTLHNVAFRAPSTNNGKTTIEILFNFHESFGSEDFGSGTKDESGEIAYSLPDNEFFNSFTDADIAFYKAKTLHALELLKTSCDLDFLLYNTTES